MGKGIHYPTDYADCVPAAERSDTATIGTTEFRDAVACLYGIIQLSPRIAHQIMRKIIGVYRSLAAIANGQSV
jgi:hypothetical protein